MTGKADTRWLPPLTFLIGFVALYLSAMPLFDDPDVPWHLATGALLLNTHHLPATDPWSFASHGVPWYNLAWLWDVIIGIVERVGGAFGVYLFAVAICAGLLSFLASELLKRGIALQAVLLTLLLAGLCMLEFTSARPHLSGYVLTLVFHHILHESRKTQRYGKLALLLPLMLLWVNLHGSFIIGFTLLIAYGAEAFFTKQRDWLRRLIVVSAASFIAALCNPYGPAVITGMMGTLGGAALPYLIEWQPFAFGKSIGLSAWLLVFLLASNVRVSLPLADKILAFAWLLAMLHISRNGAVFMLVSAPYLAACLDAQTEGLREREVQLPAWLQLSWQKSAAAVAVLAVTVSLMPHEGRLASPQHSATDAIDFAMGHAPQHHYLSDYGLGGQIIYRTQGKLYFFMDSRNGTVYSEEAIKTYLAFWLLEDGWQEKLKAYGIDGVLVGNTSPFAKAYADGRYRDHWKLVFAGKSASVYSARP